VKRLSATFMTLSVLLSTVAGCGGSSAPPPPVTLSCKTHILPSGAIRAAISVHSTLSHPGSAILYGPALRLVTHEYPLLSTRFVIDRSNGAQITYIGFLVPRIKANGTAHLLLRFRRPAQSRSVLVTNGPHVNGASTQNGRCVIKGR
jgi:hypothetical protein